MNWSNWLRDSGFAAGGPAAMVLLGGCVSASLATNTGPRPPGQHWSTAPIQQVHCGEEVRFDFVLVDPRGRLLNPLGLADYCVAFIGAERFEADPEPNGHFRFVYSFDRIQPGATIPVRADAYRRVGGRDYIRVQGQWLQSLSPYEIADKRIAGDTLILAAYQVEIELSLVRPPDDLEPDSGVLRIRRDDGVVTSVYIDRPGRPGFALTGPDADGYYRVRYTPTGGQLNPVGKTEVEFVIYDLAGHRHRVTAELDTP